MVYLARKGGKVVHHTSKAELKALDGIDEEEMTVTDAEFEAAGGIARIIGGEIVLGKTAAEIQAENDTKEMNEIIAEIEKRDYRALKAMKLGVELDSLYPGESQWYEQSLNRVHELEVALGIN